MLSGWLVGRDDTSVALGGRLGAAGGWSLARGCQTCGGIRLRAEDGRA